MPDTSLSFKPLAEAVDRLITSVDPTSLSRRRQRTVESLSFQVRTLRSVGDLVPANFRRADWAVGQQAVIAIPLLVTTLQQRSPVSSELVDRCLEESRALAMKLTNAAEGRSSCEH